MSIIKKPFKRLVEGGGGTSESEYIDLGDLAFEDEAGALGGAKGTVKVAEVYRYEDVGEITTQLYNGNVVLIDYTAIANDDLALKRIISDLKVAAKDLNGDVAGVGKNFLVATPSGLRVDRNKIKGGY